VGEYFFANLVITDLEMLLDLGIRLYIEIQDHISSFLIQPVVAQMGVVFNFVKQAVCMHTFE
jgi:hypothetical protein